MLSWLHDIPLWLGAIAVCAVFLVPTLAGSYLLQPSVARVFQGERDINTVLGFLLNAFALYFGVLLALLSIAVFENHSKAEDAVAREAAGLMTLYRDLKAYPDPLRTELTGLLHRYVDEVVGPGWKLQGRGEASPVEVRLMNELHQRVRSFQPSSQGESLHHAQTLRTIDQFTESRRLRISAGGAAIPKIMWFIVLAGAVMNAFVIWMFDLRPSTHAIIGGTLSLFIGLVIYMIAVLDVPFRGAYGLNPTDIAEAYRESSVGE